MQSVNIRRCLLSFIRRRTSQGVTCHTLKSHPSAPKMSLLTSTATVSFFCFCHPQWALTTWVFLFSEFHQTGRTTVEGKRSGEWGSESERVIIGDKADPIQRVTLGRFRFPRFDSELGYVMDVITFSLALTLKQNYLLHPLLFDINFL